MNFKHLLIAIFSLFLLFYCSPHFIYAQSAPHPLGGFIRGIGAYTSTGAIDVNADAKNLEKILSTIIGFLTIVGGIFFIMYFITGALSWSTAGGKPDKVEEAKTRMTNAAIGLIIVVAAYSVIYIISKVLGLDILNVGTLIKNQLKP